LILTKYDLKFAVQLTEQFVTLGFVTLRFYCTSMPNFKLQSYVEVPKHVASELHKNVAFPSKVKSSC